MNENEADGLFEQRNVRINQTNFPNVPPECWEMFVKCLDGISTCALKSSL